MSAVPEEPTDVADPALDLLYPMKGPFAAEHLDHRAAAKAAMELARLAGVLPAFLVDPEPAGEAQAVSPEDLAEWKDTGALASARAVSARWRDSAGSAASSGANACERFAVFAL